MTRTVFIVAIVLAAWAALPAQAEDVTVGGLKISAPWARATPKGASVGGGYMKITNTGTAPDRLVGGSTDISGSFEVHEMKMEGDVMKMRPVAGGLEIKPGQTVTFDPSGYHVMFVDLKEQLVQGERFKATLEFAKAGKVDVDFTIEGIGAQTGGGDHDHSMPGMGGMQMK
ncbi:MAG TPA: copper chaperone PCu(A)C [Pseudolabrys sp.]|jgi:copper(I)-binding protein|nr:copper chaperone PCu(A)C [Pseudolabrys sp.]